MSERGQLLQAPQPRLADVHDVFRHAIRQRDFAAMDAALNVFRELRDDQQALGSGEPVVESAGAAVHAREPVMLGAWEYLSLCETCHGAGIPQSWSTTGRQIRVEYFCGHCQGSWQVSSTENLDLPSARELALRARARADANTHQAKWPAAAHRPSEPPDMLAALGAVVAAIILGGGAVSRLLHAMHLL